MIRGKEGRARRKLGGGRVTRLSRGEGKGTDESASRKHLFCRRGTLKRGRDERERGGEGVVPGATQGGAQTSSGCINGARAGKRTTTACREGTPGGGADTRRGRRVVAVQSCATPVRRCHCCWYRYMVLSYSEIASRCSLPPEGCSVGLRRRYSSLVGLPSRSPVKFARARRAASRGFPGRRRRKRLPVCVLYSGP